MITEDCQAGTLLPATSTNVLNYMGLVALPQLAQAPEHLGRFEAVWQFLIREVEKNPEVKEAAASPHEWPAIQATVEAWENAG